VLCCGSVLYLCHVCRAKARIDSDPVIRARRTLTKAGVAWSASEQRESWIAANSRLKSPLVTQIRIGARDEFPTRGARVEASSLPPLSSSASAMQHKGAANKAGRVGKRADRSWSGE
jgi:hypothetical protein